MARDAVVSRSFWWIASAARERLALRRQQIAPLPARAVRPGVPSGRVGELAPRDIGPRDGIWIRRSVRRADWRFPPAM